MFFKNKNKLINRLGLTFGFGRNNCLSAFKKTGINMRTHAKKVKIKKLNKIKFSFRKHLTDKLLKNKINEYINFYIKIKIYRGMRHKNKLPVRGQRTHTNAKTIKKIKKLKL